MRRGAAYDRGRMKLRTRARFSAFAGNRRGGLSVFLALGLLVPSCLALFLLRRGL